MSIQKNIITLFILLLFCTWKIHAFNQIDTIPIPPPFQGSNSKEWSIYKNDIKERFEKFSENRANNKILKEEILAISIQYLTKENPFYLSNSKVYEIANSILSLELNSGIVFLLKNININIDNSGVSHFSILSHYPIYYALYEQFRKDNEVIKMQVIGVLLSGVFLKNCDIKLEKLQFYRLFISGYVDSLKYIEIKPIPNNYNCMGENLSVVVSPAKETFDFGHIINKEFLDSNN